MASDSAIAEATAHIKAIVSTLATDFVGATAATADELHQIFQATGQAVTAAKNLTPKQIAKLSAFGKLGEALLLIDLGTVGLDILKEFIEKMTITTLVERITLVIGNAILDALPVGWAIDAVLFAFYVGSKVDKYMKWGEILKELSEFLEGVERAAEAKAEEDLRAAAESFQKVLTSLGAEGLEMLVGAGEEGKLKPPEKVAGEATAVILLSQEGNKLGAAKDDSGREKLAMLFDSPGNLAYA